MDRRPALPWIVALALGAIAGALVLALLPPARAPSAEAQAGAITWRECFLLPLPVVTAGDLAGAEPRGAVEIPAGWSVVTAVPEGAVLCR